MKTIYDLELKNGMSFIGEEGIISIHKTERLKEDFYLSQKEKYPFLEGISINDFFYDYDKYGIPNRYWLTAKNFEYEETRNIFVALILKNSFKISSSSLNDDILSDARVINDKDEYDDLLAMESSIFFVEFNLKKVEELYKEKVTRSPYGTLMLSNKLRLDLKDIAKKIIFNSINNRRELVYEIEYFPFHEANSKRLLEAKSFFPFFGETMNKNGIRKVINKDLKETSLKPLMLSPLSEEDIKKMWHKLSILISPENIQLSIPKINIVDMEELVEIQMEGESELFSKNLFVIETMFYDKGELGKELQKFVKKKILDAKR